MLAPCFELLQPESVGARRAAREDRRRREGAVDWWAASGLVETMHGGVARVRQVVSVCVNTVGVDVNTASPALLQVRMD